MSRLAAAVAGCVALAAATVCAAAQDFETTAERAFMVDAETGAVLFSREPDAPFPPASLAKLMTVEVIFDALEGGRLSTDDAFLISENAWRTGGAPAGTTTMFAKVKSTVPLAALIQGIIVQYANDACIAVAEGMAGSEDNFAQTMNRRARAIGLETSTFVNATGLPADGQRVTARELTMLARHLWREYPQYYPYFAQPAFEWNGIFQRNRNPLVRMDIGVDGLGIGYAEEAGYAATVSAVRAGRRLFATVSGFQSGEERVEEARKMLDWGFGAFEKRRLFAEGEIIGEARVYGGEKDTLTLRVADALSTSMPRADSRRVFARIVYEGPVPAPVEEGAQIGTLQIWVGDTLSREAPLFAAEQVARGTLRQRAFGAVRELLVGWLR